MKIDVTAENRIIEILKERQANVLLITEEAGELYIGDKQKAIKSGEKIIVDPIDGSNNSVRGIPYCSVSIAYALGDKLASINKAVILDLTSKDLYWTEKGKGAYLNDTRISVSNNSIGDQLIFEIDFDLETLPRDIGKYVPILQKLYRVRVMGSIALTFCMLAKGSIDGVIDFRRSSRLMDIAAGYLIIKEAGGLIFSNKGENLDINLQLNAEVPLAASNGKLEKYLKEELKKINK